MNTIKENRIKQAEKQRLSNQILQTQLFFLNYGRLLKTTINQSEAIENNASIAFIQNAKRYLSKMFYPIAVIAIFACMILFTSNSAMANGYGYGDYIDVTDLKLRLPDNADPPCDNGDCQEDWQFFKFEFDQTIGYEVSYKPNEVTEYKVGIYTIEFYWRFCNGIIEIQLGQIFFDTHSEWHRIEDELNQGQTPDLANIPIQMLINGAMQAIMQKQEKNGYNNNYNEKFEQYKNGVSSFMQTTIGSCWAIKRCIDWGPIDFHNAMIIDIETPTPSESFPWPKYYYYSTHCEGTACCSDMYEVSNDEIGNAIIKKLYPIASTSNCSEFYEDVQNDNSKIIWYNIECQPVCDWHNFAVIYWFHIPIEETIIDVKTKVSTNQFIVEVINKPSFQTDVNFKIVDSYGNTYYEEITALYKGQQIISNNLPIGNYHYGFFGIDNKLIQVGNFIITSN